jgi:Fur family ferric uptake transcriptional regulator
LSVALALQDELKAAGLRMTPQRRLIADAIASLDGPITADKLHRYVVRQFPDVNLTTVYRTLETLEAHGLISHTHVHDGVAHYHLASESAHQHLVCLACHEEVELDPAVLEPLAEELRQRYGFNAILGHAALVGICRECQRKTEPATGASSAPQLG